MRPPIRTAALLTGAALVLSGCGSQFGSSEKTAQDDSARQKLAMMIAASTDAEADSLKKAVARWEKKTGHQVRVQVAQDLNQQLGQALAGGEPPDVFYVTSDQFANYADGGSLYAYGDQVEADGFVEGLRASFSHEDELVCVPKDSSTLALAINNDLWKKAGLTDDDVPTDWQELEDVAGKLTKGDVTGLVFDPTYNRVGAFMRQSGGWITDDGQQKMAADTPENLRALTYVKDMLRSGSLKYSKQVDSGWGGEAFGKERAAMTIEGNWLTGALRNDYPDLDYRTVELPGGPEGQGTLSFSTCWGVAEKSAHHEAAVDLVEALTAPDQQMTFAEAFGVMPSRTEALGEYGTAFPESGAFVAGTGYAEGPVTLPGFAKVLQQFDTDLAGLRTGDPEKILAELQRNGEQALADR
ncbi:extracellular solute-binding protein [Streptomyces sp. RKND-216]|uniref:sugar ABC transporter substrate-binding protein n=1 Tax=Streptomyces sp. RKND-216 TaxID=2562581 RepID=UPI00109DC02F|nr:extracellular solute-binding protein [Streptomyces sp. RKND-216]THA24360.1 extracellular solute-binding protein [Streptomyces sp. RKND-216]